MQENFKGTEVFIGGLPRTVTEDKIRQVFSSCGEIVEIRLIKDQNGALKGFGFVHFKTKEAAERAVREKSGSMIDGKKIGVLPSTQQDTLYFGSLNKAWGTDEFKQIVHQVLSDVVSVNLVMLKDAQAGLKQQNRGFAFVKFSSHAAASRAQRVASQPDFRLGNLHPIVQWAEEEPESNPREHSEIKVAFVRNLPSDADEHFVKQLFEPFGKVEKVVISKNSSTPVGFVHFSDRSDLDRSVKALNEKTIPGPSGGSVHKLQVEVARSMDKSKKRARDSSESITSVHGRSAYLKVEPTAIPFTNRGSFVHKQEIDATDPYEDAVVALPLAVKERLLRILRLGIATRFDIDVKSLYSLKELPESTAITVLDQFMLSGASSNNKGLFLAGLISKHLVDKAGLSQSSVSMSKLEHINAYDSEQFRFSTQVSSPPVASLASHARSVVARSDMYALHDTSPLPDYPLQSRTLAGILKEQHSDFLGVNRARAHTLNGRRPEHNNLDLRTSNLPGPHTQIERPTENNSSMFLPSEALYSHMAPRNVRLDEINHSPLETTDGPSYARAGLRAEEPYFPPSATSYATRHGGNTSSDVNAIANRQTTRPQMRFDPFTGEPYKFDPYTGAPIVPESGMRQF